LLGFGISAYGVATDQSALYPIDCASVQQRHAEWTICQPLLPTLNSTMLCMADRGFNGFEHWQQASQTGAQLLWRVAKSRNLPVNKVLDDGSFLSTIYRRDKKSERALESIEVRIIEYALPNMPESEPRRTSYNTASSGLR